MKYVKVIVNVVYVTLKLGNHEDLPTKEIPGVRRCLFKSPNYYDVINAAIKKKTKQQKLVMLFLCSRCHQRSVFPVSHRWKESVLFFRFSSASQYIHV